MKHKTIAEKFVAAEKADRLDWERVKFFSWNDLCNMRSQIVKQQAKIDALMLEYCPDELTSEQRENWARHQVPVSKAEQNELEESLEQK